MTTTKSEIKIYESSEKGVTAMRKASFRNTGPDRYVRLSDYEALQAECERWKNSASGAHQQLTANRIETEKLAVDWSKATAECEKLRTILAQASEFVFEPDRDCKCQECVDATSLLCAIHAAMQADNPC